ncbi:MAG: response regulator transcription factor [Patescibacteria group bacterium]|nr:response regulator transcription factor [Patescibacteria group bacterium]
MRILVVEDDQQTGEILKENLEAESYAVDLEQDGAKGLYRAKTNDYDFIILDNILPNKEGSEICQELRYSGKMMPIMMLTVQDEINRKVGALNIGADDYLTKPYSYAEFSARVRALLRRPKQVEGMRLAVDDLILDKEKGIVSRAGREIYLTGKEFALLEYLMKNHGRLVTRGMILEHVWDNNGDLFSNTIETHILRLRRKIDLRNKRRLIHTVPGRGYRISLDP